MKHLVAPVFSTVSTGPIDEVITTESVRVHGMTLSAGGANTVFDINSSDKSITYFSVIIPSAGAIIDIPIFWFAENGLNIDSNGVGASSIQLYLSNSGS